MYALKCLFCLLQTKGNFIMPSNDYSLLKSTFYHWQIQTNESRVSFKFSKDQVPDAQSLQKHASILCEILFSEIPQWLQRAVSSFLPLAKMRQAGYSINTKLLQHYWRYVLNTFSGYLEELFCINYLCSFTLSVFGSRICHMCKMCIRLGLQNNGSMSVRDSGSSHGEDKHRDCSPSLLRPLN